MGAMMECSKYSGNPRGRYISDGRDVSAPTAASPPHTDILMNVFKSIIGPYEFPECTTKAV
jgi:hypothetical protein